MSDWKKYIYPPLYVIFLLVAIYLIYKAFTLGLEKGSIPASTPPCGGRPAVVEQQTYDLAALLEPADSLLPRARSSSTSIAPPARPRRHGRRAKSAGLNPPPRKFPSEQFKQGAGTLRFTRPCIRECPAARWPHSRS